MIRQPAVAGRFYPTERHELAATVDACLSGEAARQRVVACLVPHAGYVYSGHVAGAVYGSVEVPDRIIVLGPNHRGRGEPLATATGGGWVTPLGIVSVDESLAEELLRAMPGLRDDPVAHQSEHSIEVQLPFLQRAVRNCSFVPVCVGTSNPDVLLALGMAIASVVQKTGDPVLIVCSSDMNHYEPDDVTRLKDSHAIAPMLALDPSGLFEVVHRERISMCGFGPAVATCEACRRLGASTGKLVKYATSADVNGDCGYVVGYAGITIA